MNKSDFKGLSFEEVSKRKSLGLSNSKIDSFSPSYLTIVRRNLFNLMNIILIPLIITLAYFDTERESVIFTIFVVLNTVMNSADEIRIKKRLERLVEEFKLTVTVIREGVQKEIGVNEVVVDDLILAKEGDAIVTDGVILYQSYVQLDESALTGESDYLLKRVEDKVFSGSFVVAGELIYKAGSVGKDNYLNKLGEKSLTYVRSKSRLEKIGDRFITFFVVTGIATAVINFIFAKEGGYSNQDSVLSITTLIAMIVPQTLIFLFSLSFVISITKLAGKGILVQKRGAIDDLSLIDTICIDKTGTITTNKMKVIDIKTSENMSFDSFKKIMGSINHLVINKNKTALSVFKFLETENVHKVTNFEMLPFTSKVKFSAYKFDFGQKDFSLIMGAPSIILDLVETSKRSKVEEELSQIESRGLRTLLILVDNIDINLEENDKLIDHLKSKELTFSKYALVSIKEELNPGIKDVVSQLYNLGIDIKVISGDSPTSVSRIINKAGIKGEKINDLSKDELDISASVFTRAKPEDKYKIITMLQANGKKVAMIGDGINDVLGLKQATVGIAMEQGSKITRDVADIVLLGNDYKKIPEIFFEGNNIIFNLKLTTKIYTSKAFIAFVLTLFFAFLTKPIPILPSTTLIFSFLGGTFPAYLVLFSRQQVKKQTDFEIDIIKSAVPSGIFIGVLTIFLYLLYEKNLNFDKLNTFLSLGLLSLSLIYALNVIWKSGKFKNIWAMFLFYGFGFGYGIAQTILPFYLYLDENPILAVYLAFLAVWASVAIWFGMTTLTKNKKVGASLGFLNLLLALAFPCRLYYATEPVPVKNFAGIVVISLIGLLGIILIHRIGDLLLKDKNV